VIEAVTLDATRTLFEPRDLGGDYARVLSRHGLERSADDWAAAVVATWREFACSADPGRDRFAAHPGGARGFWRRFVERAAALSGAAPPSAFAAAELYEHFARGAAWRVYGDVGPGLAALAASGVRLAVVSNWDERLPRLLDELGLASRFAAIVVSSEVGVEKPHPRIFEVALERLDVRAGRALHVGDAVLEDVEGARGAGLHALRLDRRGGGDLAGLDELAGRLASFA
jgi:putative hydrolase of the HAD superfamily